MISVKYERHKIENMWLWMQNKWTKNWIQKKITSNMCTSVIYYALHKWTTWIVKWSVLCTPKIMPVTWKLRKIDHMFTWTFLLVFRSSINSSELVCVMYTTNNACNLETKENWPYVYIDFFLVFRSSSNSPELSHIFCYTLYISVTNRPIPTSTVVGQAAACAPVTQRARVRSPVGTSFLGEVFSRFFLTCKTNVRKL